MGESIDRNKLYEKLRKLDKKVKAKPKTLKSKDGTFLLDPTNKHDREWFENDEEFEGHLGDKDE